MKPGRVALLFALLFALGLVFHTGWGTPSAFGVDVVAALCPVGALETWAASGTIAPRAFWALLATVIAVLLIGRAFCGWICPISWFRRRLGREGLVDREKEHEHAKEEPGEAAGKATEAASGEEARPSRAPYWVLGGAIASAAAFGFPVFCLVCPVGLFFALLVGLWRFALHQEFGWSLLWAAGFLAFELLVLRHWCASFCPIGALLTLLSRFNRTFRPAADPKACVTSTRGLACRLCTRACPEGIDLARVFRGHLPPEELARCTKCGACKAVCPTHAIAFPLTSAAFAAEHDNRIEKIEKVEMVEKAVPSAGASATTSATGAAEDVPRRNVRGDSGPMTPYETVLEAERCLLCGACAKVCPQHRDPTAWLRPAARGSLDEAEEILLRPGALPEICGLVCPSERLCERACILPVDPDGTGGPIAIAALERSIAENGLASGRRPAVRRPRERIRVAVVGSGPAGLACADALARFGATVEIFEKRSDFGGMLSHGMPPFKMPRETIAKRVAALEALGVVLHAGTDAAKGLELSNDSRDPNTSGATAPLRPLPGGFDAIFLAFGAEAPAPLGLAHEEAEGVLSAKDLLERPSDASLAGLRVLVAGGGDTAIDAARMAIREGAAQVIVLSRNPRNRMKAHACDVLLAETEGVRFLCEYEVAGILADEDGRFEAVEVRTPEGTERIAADRLVAGVGFRPSAPDWVRALGVETDPIGRVRARNTRTARPGIYAGGDAVHGSALVSTAVGDGRRAAEAILLDFGVLPPGETLGAGSGTPRPLRPRQSLSSLQAQTRIAS